MRLLDILKKKKPKCADCLQIIQGHAWKVRDKEYCRSCYNRNMANGIRGKIATGRDAGATFVCDVCQRELWVKYRQRGTLCADCAADPKAQNVQTKAGGAEEFLDDVTFIRELRRTVFSGWQQYDILFAAQIYGWDWMIGMADYMGSTDLTAVSEVQVGELSISKTDITEAYRKNGCTMAGLAEAATERGMLSVAGISKVLAQPMKIVMMNQTRTLRLFTLVEDEQLIRKYAETMVRRSFGTENAMKLGKPIPEENREPGGTEQHKAVTAAPARPAAVYGTDSDGRATFVCCVCKRERRIKYRQKENLCVDCADAWENRARNPEATEEYIVKLKKYAMQYIPGPVREIGTQRQMLKMLEPVLFVNESMMGMNVQKIFENNDLGQWPMFHLQGVIAAHVDRWLGTFREEMLYQKTEPSSTESLIKAWSVLAFYCDILKPEYKRHLERWYKHIASEIYGRGFAVPEVADAVPVEFQNGSILISSEKLIAWKKQNPHEQQFTLLGALPLTEKEPVIALFEDGVKTREYVLQTEGEEDFTGKYFQISVRLGFLGSPAVPVAQIDGFVSDTPEERQMNLDDIGYRMEGHFLAFGGDEGKRRYEMTWGQDLPVKGLKYPGYTTPSNIRLVGICPNCGKSFCFHGYAYYMIQSDVAYSDDGLDCCEIQAQGIDRETWTYETEGKTFRYYNSFHCPHCGTPYIDYRKYPEKKEFGVSGCVHLGRRPYQCR